MAGVLNIRMYILRGRFVECLAFVQPQCVPFTTSDTAASAASARSHTADASGGK